MYLQAAGHDVPNFFAISVAAFRDLMQQAAVTNRIEALAALPTEQEVLREAAAIRTMIADSTVSKELTSLVAEALLGLQGAGGYVAVRSSALDEDSADQSFAGMHDSFLFVRGETNVITAIRDVWASAFNDRAVVYRLRAGIPLHEIAVAVIVQEMVDADRSGVMFTCNPGSDNVHEVVVSSLYGVGEGLVSAGLAADTFVVAKDHLAIDTEVAVKSEQLVLDEENGGLSRSKVADDKQTVSSLEPAEIRSIARIGMDVEQLFGRPQDIEFCYDKRGRLLLLQSRPVTNMEERGPAAGHRLVWDNSNIIESYAGVTSPMTFSFIRRAYTIVYHCFAQVMGISQQKVHDSQRVFENMLGLFRGRVYYNLANWYRLIRLFPGFQYNAAFMESMMGLKEKLELDDEPPRPSFWQRWFVELPALVWLLGRSVLNFLRIRGIVAQFETNFREHYGRWSELDLDGRKPHELMQLYFEMEDTLLWNWKAPIINDFYVMLYYGLLKKLCGGWCGDTSGSLQNDLICGEGGVESAEPAKHLLRLANLAQGQPALRTLITDTPSLDLPERVAGDSRFTDFQSEFDHYLQLYGFRWHGRIETRRVFAP